MLLIGQMIDLRMLIFRLIFLLPISVSAFFCFLPASGTLSVLAFLCTDSGTQSDQALTFWLNILYGSCVQCAVQDWPATTAGIRFVGTLTINAVISNG